MRRTPRVGDIVVVMKKMCNEGCVVCERTIGQTALVAKMGVRPRVSTLQFKVEDISMYDFPNCNLYDTGLTA